MVIQTRGSGIGTQTAPILSAQITAPAKMISPRIPYPAVIIPGGLCIAVVQHGVKRHLERDIHRAGVPHPDADRCAKAAARTLAASHQLVAADAKRCGVRPHVQQRREAVVQRGRIPVCKCDRIGYDEKSGAHDETSSASDDLSVLLRMPLFLTGGFSRKAESVLPVRAAFEGEPPLAGMRFRR